MKKTKLPWQLIKDTERECVFIFSDEEPNAFPVARIDINEGRYVDAHLNNAKFIVMAANCHDDLWNVCAGIANFLNDPIALDDPTIASLRYLAGMANRIIEKAKTY